jgi:hypothetical protein
MDPSTVTTTQTSTSQTLQQLQAQAAQSAHAVGQNFLSVYFADITWVEALSVLITLGLLAAIVYYAIETGWYANRVDRFKHVILQSDMSKEHGQEAWHHIQEAFCKGSENDLKVSVMEGRRDGNALGRSAKKSHERPSSQP